jgi:mono/diheme cytochrome c family protein
MRYLHFARPAALACAAVVISFAAQAQGSRRAILDEGRMEFEENCAACHGKDGTGRGELGARLAVPPKDLTTFAQRNGGVFPFWPVFEVIAGEKPIPGHDTLDMPLFSGRMRAQEGHPGFLPSHVRMLEVTHYLESIQKK